MSIAFGVHLSHLPRLPFRLPVEGAHLANVEWSHTTGDVDGAEFWMHDLGSRLSVGWSGFGSYDIALSSPSRVEVTLETDPSEAAVAFVFSVLPLVLPAWK